MKDAKWGACKAACTPGAADPRDINNETWSCDMIGQRTGAASWQSPSLFCFSIIRPTGYEPEIMKAQLAKKAGIFACDEYAILSSGYVTIGEDFFGPIKSLHFETAVVGISKDGTAANTELFMNAWDAVNKDGRAWNHDWTLKVDPDAVLLPDRLRSHLIQHQGANVYVVNCDKPMMTPMMFGSVEIFSFKAIQSFFNGFQNCKQGLPWQSWGEDYFMGNCLNSLGTVGLWDFSIVQDGVCKGVWCKAPGAAAFHPFKTVEGWMQCWAEATGAPAPAPAAAAR
jgi:hypothetical protein